MRDVTSREEFEDILKTSKDKLVVVDFFATWCRPCMVIGPAVKTLEERFQKDVIFLKVDVDELSDLAEDFEIEAMPTFMFFRNGQKVNECMGANQVTLTKAIEDSLGS